MNATQITISRRVRQCFALIGIGLLATLTACQKETATPAAAAAQASTPPPAPSTTTNAVAPTPAATNAAPAQVPVYTYDVVNVWPHDRKAFTQGLVFLKGGLLESTGLNGESSLREVEISTGNVIRRKDVPSQFFAEGLALLNGKLFQLTWLSKKGFVYDLVTFQLEKEFTFTGEGWGLATDGKWLIMSDGTSQIRFLDPETFEVKRTIDVTYQDKPLRSLNELEYIKGEIFANVWGSDFVVRIAPDTGRVVGLIDFRGLLPISDRAPDTDVLNGIAYDTNEDRLFVTGKRWPKMFEVHLKQKY